MSSSSPIPYRQDLPPPSGFGTVQYKRSLPFKGPSGAVIFTAIGLIMGVGWYRTLNARAERKELMREEKTSRIHQLPFLYAERDRDIYRRSRAAEAREAIIMKDVKGWEVGKLPYNTDRYVEPTIVI